MKYFLAILLMVFVLQHKGQAAVTESPDDDDDWEEPTGGSTGASAAPEEADDDGRIYKNPRNSPSAMCPRDEDQATLLGQKCLRKCSSDEDCKSKKKKCLCDGACGMSCIKPDRECPELDKPELGDVTVSGRLFGDKAVYSCPHGYHVVGLQSRNCQADGQWAGQPPACKQNIYCLTPPHIEHARHSALPEQATFDLDATIQYHCHTGYVTNGFPRAKCLAIEGQASWYGPDITCEPRSCGPPGELPHGWVTAECHTFGCRAALHCGAGFELVGRAERFCQPDGAWAPNELPTCVLVTAVQCPPPDAPRHGRAVYTSCAYNSIVSYECKYGYRLVGDNTRRCGADKKWSGQQPVCKEINCGHPGRLYNGWLENIEAGTGLGASIIFRCHDGMRMEGNSSTVCQLDGTWTYPLPKCHAPCVVPHVNQGKVILVPSNVTQESNETSPSPATQIIGASTMGQHGQGLIVECEKNYEFLSNNPLITCNNGTWTQIPKCQPARCKRLPKPPRHGMVVAPKTDHGMRARFHCKDGFALRGPDLLQCSYGNWTGDMPYCQEVYCPFPGYIDNGKVLLVGNMGLYDYRPYVRKVVNNKQIMYDCDKGYVLSEGPPGATCIGGHWSPKELPSCTPGQHPRLRWSRRRRSVEIGKSRYGRSQFLRKYHQHLIKRAAEISKQLEIEELHSIMEKIDQNHVIARLNSHRDVECQENNYFVTRVKRSAGYTIQDGDIKKFDRRIYTFSDLPTYIEHSRSKRDLSARLYNKNERLGINDIHSNFNLPKLVRNRRSNFKPFLNEMRRNRGYNFFGLRPRAKRDVRNRYQEFMRLFNTATQSMVNINRKRRESAEKTYSYRRNTARNLNLQNRIIFDRNVHNDDKRKFDRKIPSFQNRVEKVKRDVRRAFVDDNRRMILQAKPTVSFFDGSIKNKIVKRNAPLDSSSHEEFLEHTNMDHLKIDSNLNKYTKKKLSKRETVKKTVLDFKANKVDTKLNNTEFLEHVSCGNPEVDFTNYKKYNENSDKRVIIKRDLNEVTPSFIAMKVEQLKRLWDERLKNNKATADAKKNEMKTKIFHLNSQLKIDPEATNETSIQFDGNFIKVVSKRKVYKDLRKVSSEEMIKRMKRTSRKTEKLNQTTATVPKSNKDHKGRQQQIAALPDPTVDSEIVTEDTNQNGSKAVEKVGKKGRVKGPCELISSEPYVNIEIVKFGRDPNVSYSSGTIVRVACGKGYGLNLGYNATAKCVRGRWKPAIPICEILPCHIPVTENGIFSLAGKEGAPIDDDEMPLNETSDVLNGQVVQFACETGYNVQGASNLRCWHGDWAVTSLPECIPAPCELPIVRHGVYTAGYRAGLTIAHDSSVALHCEMGFTPPATFRCDLGSLRPSSTDLCQPIQGNLSNIRDGQDFRGGSDIVREDFDELEYPTSSSGMDCGPPARVQGTLIYRDGAPMNTSGSYPHGTEVTFRCIASIMGERSTWKIVCERGNWIGKSVSCEEEDLPPSSLMGNGTCVFRNNEPNVVSFYNDLEIKEEVVEFPASAVLVSRCVDIGKYAMVGPNKRQCLGGDWDGSKPSCFGLNQECDYAMEKPPTILFRHDLGPIAQSNDGRLIVYPGTILHMECLWMRRFGNPKWNVSHEYRKYPEGWSSDPGRDSQLEFRLSIFHATHDDSGIFTCITPARQSHHIEITVEAVHCPPLPLRRGLISSSQSTKMGSEVTFSCANGNSLIGAAQLVCLPSGNWSAPLPLCESVECGEVTVGVGPASKLRVSVVSRGVGGRAAFSCAPGWGLRGSSETLCLPSGDWAHPFPTCIEVSCPAPQPPLNGYLLGRAPFRAGDVVQFNCNPAHMMQGQPIVACQDNARWSGETPKCIQACSYPGTTISGRMSSVKFYYKIGETISFTCEPGLKLKGAAMLRCLRNGKWSNAIPMCSRDSQIGNETYIGVDDGEKTAMLSDDPTLYSNSTKLPISSTSPISLISLTKNVTEKLFVKNSFSTMASKKDNPPIITETKSEVSVNKSQAR